MRTETKLLKPLLQVVAVSLSLFVGWSRIADNKHFLTDVLAGFVLGAVFAWFVVSRALTFAVIKPSSTTFAHCHVCCKFCPPVQEHVCLFWSIYFSSNTFKRFLPLKTALFRERKPGRDTLRAKVSLLYGFVRLQSRLRRLSLAYEQRGKKTWQTLRRKRRTLSGLRAVSYFFSFQSYCTRNPSTRAAKPRAAINEGGIPRRKNKRLLTLLFCLGTTGDNEAVKVI